MVLNHHMEGHRWAFHRLNLYLPKCRKVITATTSNNPYMPKLRLEQADRGQQQWINKAAGFHHRYRELQATSIHHNQSGYSLAQRTIHRRQMDMQITRPEAPDGVVEPAGQADGTEISSAPSRRVLALSVKDMDKGVGKGIQGLVLKI